MPRFSSLSWRARLFVIAVIVVGVASVPYGWAVNPITSNQVLTLIYLAVGTQIAQLRPVPWRIGQQTVVDPLLIATGLYAPGAGVGLVTWLAMFDGRLPGRRIEWWAFLFNRAAYAAAHVLPSLLVARAFADPALLPIRAAVYVLIAVALNYLIMASSVALVRAEPFWSTLLENVGLGALGPTLALNFAGAILYLLLVPQPSKYGFVGYIIAPGLFGFVLAVRSTIADVQRQTVLKDQTIALAAQALDARDRYTESHSIRVSELSGRLGEQLELGDREVELIRMAGSLHDLGKIGVRDDILNKAGPLNEEEWEAMRQHPDIGADMIAKHSALAEIAPLVRHHHERVDGTGYPAGLKGDYIPIGARVLSVADSFDTITGARLYRRSLMTPIEAVEDISRRTNHWYDPNVVDALRELYGLRPLEVGERPPIPRRISALRVIRANAGFSNLLTAIGISSLGDPLTQVATLVTIFLATHDPRFVAMAFVAQALGPVLMGTVLGGVTDRLPRRGLVVSLELLRAGVLVWTPQMLGLCTWQGLSLSCGSSAPRWWLIIPIMFCLACINAVVQPAKQAAIPSLVPQGQVLKANAIVAATTMLTGAVGFAIAGVILQIQRSGGVLFVVDAATFVLAALVILSVPSLGGGTRQSALAGALRRSWAVLEVRPHLVVGLLAAFLLPMSLPALLAMAYRLAPSAGGQLYSILELILTVGVLIGSLLVSRLGATGTMRTAGGGLLTTGIFSLAIWLLHLAEPVIGVLVFALLASVALFVASLGNPVYTIANQTAIVEAADESNRGSLMATRFGLVQTASIVGAALGGLLTQLYGPELTYGALGLGLVALSVYALSAGGRRTSPLLGSA